MEVARGDRGWPAGSPACSVVAAAPRKLFFRSRRLEAAVLAEADKMVGQRAGSERVQIGTRFRRLAWPHAGQNSSGGKQTLGGITKQGNRYIRKMLVLGATSLLNVVGKRKGALRDWIVGLLAKKPARLVTVALANKLARILWAMMKTGECFRTEMFAKA